MFSPAATRKTLRHRGTTDHCRPPAPLANVQGRPDRRAGRVEKPRFDLSNGDHDANIFSVLAETREGERVNVHANNFILQNTQSYRYTLTA